MVTLFTSPRPFTDIRTAMIQRNAIGSWLTLRPSPQVILIGDDAGVGDIARELSVEHIREVETDDRGIPMRSAMFRLARDTARYDRLCIINADIIILDGFLEALRRITLREFVAAGQRHDLRLDESIAFDDAGWRTALRVRVQQWATLHGPSAIDYAIYPKSITPPILPPFPVNSYGWDPWFLFEHRRRRIPVVNLTPRVCVVHQEHESATEVKMKRRRWRSDPAAMKRLREAGGFMNMMTLREADYELGDDGLRRPSLSNRFLSKAVDSRLYRSALAVKRSLRKI